MGLAIIERLRDGGVGDPEGGEVSHGDKGIHLVIYIQDPNGYTVELYRD